MSSPWQPTTRAQVSGHRFLKRRVEHGLVFGDIRMIHDPLRSRSRGMIFGTVAVALGLAGAGLFAWLNPQPDPGDATILSSRSGALYVRIDDHLHPVSNLASARLIAGTPAEPVTIGDEHLATAAKGPPLGIDPAPGLFADPDPAEPGAAWGACVTAQAHLTVLADGASVTPVPLADGEALLIDGPDAHWVLTVDGRRALPPADLPEGRVLRRALGIDPTTPQLRAPAEFVTAAQEAPAWHLPDPLPEVWDTGDGNWAALGSGPDARVTRLTDTQADALTGAGARAVQVAADRPAQHPDAHPLVLPEDAKEFLDPVGRQVCALSTGEIALLPGEEVPGAVELAGETPTEMFAGLPAGAVAVDTGAGLHVVADTGIRHSIAPADLPALGIENTTPVPWEILGLLPEGPALDGEDARAAAH